MVYKFFRLFTSFLLLSFSASQDTGAWNLVSPEREFSISGIGHLKRGMVVVHDNKREGQARVGIISGKNEYAKLTWPADALPFDLEALDMIPGKPNRFIAMESSGKCYDLHFNNRSGKLNLKNVFSIPGVKRPMNLEGIAVFRMGGSMWAAWGDRGKNQFPAALYWGRLYLYSSKVETAGSFEFTVPFPESDVRHLSDLEITEDGTCWISSASDPGDDGPFDSAVYLLGAFRENGRTINFIPEKSGQPYRVYKGHKIEAIALESGKLTCGTDDENFGASLLVQDAN
ncbi:MAG: hypothetical protein QF845_02660 [Candidatus Marinimicrobia bacterium]|jgi:hypothetical protein|nr:hypothetical protein [Candidatus Neomarinimicrobiota bacterium]MDP6789417.1 hypothetical protein [Candidatus Neomarinimicrobiota bacterium]